MSFQRAPSIEVLRFLHLSPFLFPAFSTSLWLCPHLSPFLLRSVLQKETAKVRRSNFFFKEHVWTYFFVGWDLGSCISVLL